MHVIFFGNYRQIIFYLFMNLWSIFQVDICILIPFLCFQASAQVQGILKTVGEFVLSVTITQRHLQFKWCNELTADGSQGDSRFDFASTCFNKLILDLKK